MPESEDERIARLVQEGVRREMDRREAARPPLPLRPLFSPGLAAFLSFILPGLGQIYKGQFRGILYFIFAVAGYMALVVPGLIVHICSIAGAASGDPYNYGADPEQLEVPVTAGNVYRSKKREAISRPLWITVIVVLLLALIGGANLDQIDPVTPAGRVEELRRQAEERVQNGSTRVPVEAKPERP